MHLPKNEHQRKATDGTEDREPRIVDRVFYPASLVKNPPRRCKYRNTRGHSSNEDGDSQDLPLKKSGHYFLIIKRKERKCYEDAARSYSPGSDSRALS